ncbi:MAG: hypothetical protein IPN81_06795 [Nitrosomonadales bacterium]|nr:hypothetical protein [Nitrosomonadales bacterium]
MHQKNLLLISLAPSTAVAPPKALKINAGQFNMANLLKVANVESARTPLGVHLDCLVIPHAPLTLSEMRAAFRCFTKFVKAKRLLPLYVRGRLTRPLHVARLEVLQDQNAAYDV